MSEIKIIECETINDKNTIEDFEVVWNSRSPYYIGETLKSLKEKYEEDQYLNNIEVQKWRLIAISTIGYNRINTFDLSLFDFITLHKKAAIKLIKSKEI